MRTINVKEIGSELIDLLNDDDTVDEDIGIIDHEGNVLGVVIPKDAYEFFLRKVEEAEDEMDLKTAEEFNASNERNT
ncbi:hypothetical protein [Sessilibacter sp. MAH2]